MTFLHPQWLALLALPVVLAFWEWVRRGQVMAMPFDHGTRGRGRWLRFLVLGANCLPACLLAVAILFLAHPIVFNPPEIERRLTNIQIVLDTSGSMAENHGTQENGRHTRFDSAMESVLKFTRYRQGDAFGLTIFSRNFIHWIPLTLDTESIALARPFIIPNNPKLDPPSMGRHGMPNELWGGTFVGKALYGAAEHLAERPAGDRMIILLTDGESSDIKPPLDVPIIADLQAKHIAVFAILMTDLPVEPALIGIARSSGGGSFNAVTPEALNTVFKRIDEMKKVVVLEKKPQATDYYDPFFIPALGFLLCAVFALFGLRFTPW
ncbi:MAG: VWA domain-containing protein [Opitutales bacterium]|jgi:Ca-activated chloride channel family protein|nr:MAG: VWA domain-containing protein [Opitutales bacterium]